MDQYGAMKVIHHEFKKRLFQYGITLDTDITIHRDWALNRFVATLYWWCVENKIRIEVLEWYAVPVTWWDAFKIRFFHKWLRQRYPARMEKINTVVNHYHLCPHMRSERKEDHIDFLLYEPEEPNESRTNHREEV